MEPARNMSKDDTENGLKPTTPDMPDGSPESYSPRTKPVLLSMAETARNAGADRAAAKVLQGVRHIAYGNPSAVCFIGSVMAVMEYLGDPVDDDELFALSGVALCFPWKERSCCDEVSILAEIPQRTFRALGYGSEYLYEPDITGAPRAYSRELYKTKIMDSIDRGRPVIGFGFTHGDPFTCVITGYESDGDRLLLRAYWSPDGLPTGYDATDLYYTVEDWYDKCYGIVVVGEKTGDRLAGDEALRFLAETAAILKDKRAVPSQGQTVAAGLSALDAMTAWLLDDDAWRSVEAHHGVFLAPCGLLLLGHYRSYLYAYLAKRFQEPLAPNRARLLSALLCLRNGIGGEDSQLHLDQKVSAEIDGFSKLTQRPLREKVAAYVQRLKQYDTEILDLVEQLPEGYGPQTQPVIVSYAQHAANAAARARPLAVKAADGGHYIDGFPMLRWGQWQDCTYGGAVTAMLSAMGIGATYEHVMGLCGAAYRICMRKDWDPSSTMPQNGVMAEEAMNRAFGVDVYSLADEAARDANVVRSLGAGVPVLVCGQRAAPEWTVVTGHAWRGGRTMFFGRTYFDYEIAKQGEVFTANGYRLADQYPGEVPRVLLRFYDRRCEPLPALEALKKSLEMCVAIYEQPSGRYNHRFGDSAYDVLIRGFELPVEEYRKRCSNDQYHIGSLMDARRAAYIYLEESAALLAGDNRKRLLAVAALYRDMLDALLAAVPYERTCAVFAGGAPAQGGEELAQHHFPPVGNSAPVWDGATRARLVAALRKAVRLEREVRVLVRGILEAWS